MKKVILFAAAILFGLFAYAQNIPGSPTAGYVPALPGAGAGANTGLSVQNGDDNRVRVRQAGTFQSVYTYQDNGAGSGGNMALVRQTGAVGPNSGVANAAMTVQRGTENSSITLQEGDWNNAVTRQGTNNPSSAGNKALIRQGVANQAEYNRAAIDQDGNDNRARTRQTWDNNDAWTQQFGNENKSMITQNGSPEDSDGQEAWNYQQGNRNENAIDQAGNGGRNVARTQQLGEDNQAKQFQRTNASAGTAGNNGLIVQGVSGGPFWNGTDLDKYVAAQNDIGAAFDNVGNNVWGQFPPSPNSIGAKAKQIQFGKMNEAEIVQMGGTVGASNYAEQVQASGWNNVAVLAQGHYFNGDPSNYGKQFQAGDNNRAGMFSSGSGQKTLQDQRGHRNTALGTQLGRNHRLNVHQRGNDNSANTGQHGDGNAALVVQYDGQSYSVYQNLPLGPTDFSGGGNQADILQLGPDGNFDDAAIICDFEDPMNLDMDYYVPMPNLPDICPDC